MSLDFSRRAESDLLEIGAYTLQNWGAKQVARYLDRLEACCRALAANPRLGRPCDEIRAGLRRSECVKHIIFYRSNASGIVISRILHQRMLPEHHDLDDQRKEF